MSWQQVYYASWQLLHPTQSHVRVPTQPLEETIKQRSFSDPKDLIRSGILSEKGEGPHFSVTDWKLHSIKIAWGPHFSKRIFWVCILTKQAWGNAFQQERQAATFQ